MTDPQGYYYRPLVQWGRPRPPGALALAGGPLWFAHVERLERRARGRAGEIIAAEALPGDVREALTAPRAPVAGIDLMRPGARIMGILNVTPDSFSDGGRHLAPERAIEHARAMRDAGAEIIDIGGESTRPGAREVPADAEMARVLPVIEALSREGIGPISIDTRKAGVARAALSAGAAIVNDVSAMLHDPAMAEVVAVAGAPVCLMHAQGSPETMQQAPHYDDVVLDVYDHLAARIAAAEAAGIAKSRIILDPGIGFGKTIAHNLALLRALSLFHALGCPLLLGVSRKRFIGALGGGAALEDARARMPGSAALAVMAMQQGVQILRVHDIAETQQALALARAVMLEETDA